MMIVRFISKEPKTYIGASRPVTYKKGDTIDVPDTYGHALLRDGYWEEVKTKSKKEDKA
jgi:hypothetical protein